MKRDPAHLVCLLALCSGAATPAPGQDSARVTDGIIVAPDGRRFVQRSSGRPFVPWGFNYDHDDDGRLLEDYWVAEWPMVEEDFREMKALGANVVRIHLQFGKFMRGPDAPNPDALERLARLVTLAERTGLYLDLTGLACYRKSDVPAWYDALGEPQRWDAQARFWEAIARRCASSPAIFCYDLMNEPVVPGGDDKRTDWLGPPFADKYHYVQFIGLDRQGRSRPDVARQWIRRLTLAIRKHDRRHLITVGLVSWSLDRPGLSSGFVPRHVAGELDFISVHLYPKRGKLAEALDTLGGFDVGKPVIIEEMFPLKCSGAELGEFIQKSRGTATGWIGFYWGKTVDQCRRSSEIKDVLLLQWLDLFQKGPPLEKR